MSGHDPMCQTRTDHYPSWCNCPRVRAIRADTHNDLRAKVEALEHDTCCSESRQEAPCDCLRGEVLDLLPEEANDE